MAKDEQPITKSEMLDVLKEAGFTTKDDLKELRAQVKQDIADAIHEQLTNYHADMVAPEFAKLRAEMKTGFKQVGDCLDQVEADVHWLKDEVQGLKADLSNTPSRQEFETLKKNVARISPAL